MRTVRRSIVPVFGTVLYEPPPIRRHRFTFALTWKGIAAFACLALFLGACAFFGTLI